MDDHGVGFWDLASLTLILTVQDCVHVLSYPFKYSVIVLCISFLNFLIDFVPMGTGKKGVLGRFA